MKNRIARVNTKRTIHINEVYQALYKYLLETNVVEDEDSFLSYLFVNQKRVRVFLKKSDLVFSKSRKGVDVA